jgi:hypothetical protein
MRSSPDDDGRLSFPENPLQRKKFKQVLFLNFFSDLGKSRQTYFKFARYSRYNVNKMIKTDSISVEFRLTKGISPYPGIPLQS